MLDSYNSVMNEINEPKKDYCQPRHTAEHILNQTMCRMFNCGRSVNAHIEPKKNCKCDYKIDTTYLEKQGNQWLLPESKLTEITEKVNYIISQNLPITTLFVSQKEASDKWGALIDLSRLPEDATDTLRIVLVGDYDICPCIGSHVENTSEIGSFSIAGQEWKSDPEDISNTKGYLRLRWKVLYK